MKFTAQFIDVLTWGPFGPMIVVGTLGVLMILMTHPVNA